MASRVPPFPHCTFFSPSFLFPFGHLRSSKNVSAPWGSVNKRNFFPHFGEVKKASKFFQLCKLVNPTSWPFRLLHSVEYISLQYNTVTAQCTTWKLCLQEVDGNYLTMFIKIGLKVFFDNTPFYNICIFTSIQLFFMKQNNKRILYIYINNIECYNIIVILLVIVK